ncbi:MAG: amidohydrolase family protein [Gemmatimonadetes bacterium]|nr:amidohydrolase family protein [Gemmatimonadota bacterium]
MVEAYGPQRVMYGSDWPVHPRRERRGLAHHRQRHRRRALLAPRSDEIFGGTAIRAYRLSIHAPA